MYETFQYVYDQNPANFIIIRVSKLSSRSPANVIVSQDCAEAAVPLHLITRVC